MNRAKGWSIDVPPGWEVLETNGIGDTALTRQGAIAEILALTASGLTLEQLQAQRQDELGTWQGVQAVEGQIVRLPVGQAVRTTLVAMSPDAGRLVFVAYAIEKGDVQYVISVRGPEDDVVAAAEAIAESFALTD